MQKKIDRGLRSRFIIFYDLLQNIKFHVFVLKSSEKYRCKCLNMIVFYTLKKTDLLIKRGI
jgi:hypothetical protein